MHTLTKFNLQLCFWRMSEKLTCNMNNCFGLACVCFVKVVAPISEPCQCLNQRGTPQSTMIQNSTLPTRLLLELPPPSPPPPPTAAAASPALHPGIRLWSLQVSPFGFKTNPTFVSCGKSWTLAMDRAVLCVPQLMSDGVIEWVGGWIKHRPFYFNFLPYRWLGLFWPWSVCIKD